MRFQFVYWGYRVSEFNYYREIQFKLKINANNYT